MKSLAELQALRDSMKGKIGVRDDAEGNIRVVVGMATCGIAAGARPVLTAFTEEVSKRNLQNVTIAQTGCIGICQYEPVVEVYEPGKEKVTYVKMTPEMAVKVVNDHLVNGNVVTEGGNQHVSFPCAGLRWYRLYLLRQRTDHLRFGA